MKHRNKTLAGRLWRWFALFALILMALVWLLQTVLLQGNYRAMVKRKVKKAASEIEAALSQDNYGDALDALASENALLIVVTDAQGNLLYSTDEHSSLYSADSQDDKSENPYSHTSGDANDNPYRQTEEHLSWQIGKQHYLGLPSDYADFLSRLNDSPVIEYTSADDTAYVYGTSAETGGETRVIYVSATLAAVGATVGILRTQLMWVTAAALALSFLLAWLIARRFARPVKTLSEQAGGLANGQFDGSACRGSSAELDHLADSLEQAARDITEARSYQRDFLANISHDLRTPLTMIRGYAELVRDISWKDDSAREADLNLIISESERLTGLVNDIIDYSKLESGKIEPNMADFDYTATARQVVSQFAPPREKEGYHINIGNRGRPHRKRRRRAACPGAVQSDRQRRQPRWRGPNRVRQGILPRRNGPHRGSRRRRWHPRRPPTARVGPLLQGQPAEAQQARQRPGPGDLQGDTGRARLRLRRGKRGRQRK